MKYLCAVALLISGVSIAGTLDDILASVTERTQQQQTVTNKDVEVVELIRAESTEDLQAQLTDGYPMPWLKEILSDTTIPEEDRYWLDCRVRAAIAQDLHLFFDRDGNPIHVEAEWIAPGEEYWREHMMVYPVLPAEDVHEFPDPENQDSMSPEYLSYDEFGEPPVQYSESSPTLMSDPPGDILNLYGEKVGELAVVNRNVVFSRDASVAAVQSGGNHQPSNSNLQPYACIMYPDGSFIEYPFDDKGEYKAAVSADGSTIIFVCYHMTHIESDDDVVDAYIFDRDGNLIHRVTPPIRFSGTYFPSISCDGRFAAYSLDNWRMAIIDCEAGSIYQIVHPVSNGKIRGCLINSDAMNFSPDGDYLSTGGHSAGTVFSLEPFEMIWVSDGPNETNDFYLVSSSMGAQIVSYSLRKGLGREHYYEISIYKGEKLIQLQSLSIDREIYTKLGCTLSPNGCFNVINPENDSWISHTSIPLLIQQIRGGE